MFDPSDPTPLDVGTVVEVPNGRGWMRSRVIERRDHGPADTDLTRYMLEGPSGNLFTRRRRSIVVRGGD